MCNQNLNFSLILLFYSIQIKIKWDQSNWKMGSESNSTSSMVSVSTSTTSTTSPSAKRSRDPEDEVYVDNLHSHKRYLSEVRPCFSIFNLPFFFCSVLWDFCNFVVNGTYFIRVCLYIYIYIFEKKKFYEDLYAVYLTDDQEDLIIVQIMASSLNGLTVGDPLPENLMESPARFYNCLCWIIIILSIHRKLIAI